MVTIEAVKINKLNNTRRKHLDILLTAFGGSRDRLRRFARPPSAAAVQPASLVRAMPVHWLAFGQPAAYGGTFQSEFGLCPNIPMRYNFRA